jgi:hypothetical protein
MEREREGAKLRSQTRASTISIVTAAASAATAAAAAAVGALMARHVPSPHHPSAAVDDLEMLRNAETNFSARAANSRCQLPLHSTLLDQLSSCSATHCRLSRPFQHYRYHYRYYSHPHDRPPLAGFGSSV